METNEELITAARQDAADEYREGVPEKGDLLTKLADALEAATTGIGWEIEHRPGRMDARKRGGAFVGSSVIAPGYVGQYIAEGGSVVSRRVGPWLPLEGEGAWGPSLLERARSKS